MPHPQPIERLSFVSQQLVDERPPRLHDYNKREVYAIACPPGSVHSGDVGYTRWSAVPLETQFDVEAAASLVEVQENFYDYAPVSADGSSIEWNVNFADPRLFAFYGGGLFAQDEMQVAEHPALGSLVEALKARGTRTLTVDQDGPTPVLITGVERRVRIATDPNAAEGRPHGLYGHRFAAASREVVRDATTPISPPTTTNLIAMAAPGGSRGRYTVDDLTDVLVTAYTGFSAAAAESKKIAGDRTGAIVHTGFWGCGAFGGSRVLMAMLQLLAGSMAGLDKIVFHTGDAAGTRHLNEAVELIESDVATAAGSSTDALIGHVESMGFEWGVSDGN